MSCLAFAGCATEGPAEEPPGTPDAAPPPAARGVELCAAGQGTLERVWTVDNQHGEIVAMSLVGDDIVVVASVDGSVKQWTIGANPAAQPTYGQPFDQTGEVVRALALAPDGARLAGGDAAGRAHLWWRDDAFLVSSVTLGADPVTAVALSPDAARVALADASFAGNVRLWDPAGGALGEALPTTLWNVTSLAWSPDGATLAVAGHWYGEPSVELRPAASPADTSGVWVEHGAVAWIRAVAPAPDGARFVAAGDGVLAVLAAGDPTTPLAVAHPADHQAVAVIVTPSGEHFLTAGSEGTIRMWSMASAAEEARIELVDPVGVALDADDERLVTATRDGRVHAYRCR